MLLFGSEMNMSIRCNWFYHLLFAIFGTGSWLAINGVFSELSFLVQTAPESWNLASGLTLTIQLGNVLPLLYLIVGRCVTYKHKENAVIYIILMIGCISSVLLAFLWDSTLELMGETHSFYLFIFTFTLAAVDCTSSVTYFPFMAKFPEKFIISLMIGEGLSGLIPSVLALAQNGGTTKVFSSNSDAGTDANSNSTTNTTYYCFTDSNFSEQTYFLLIFGLFFVSGVAFLVLNILPIPEDSNSSAAKNAQKSRAPLGDLMGANRSGNSSENGSNDTNFDEMEHEEQKRNLLSIRETVKIPRTYSGDEERNMFQHSLPLHPEEEDNRNNMQSVTASSSVSFLHSFAGCVVSRSDVVHLSSLFAVCFIFNGALPSISTYILLPYGNEEMLVVSNIGNIANPLTCIVMMILPFTTSLTISCFSSLLTVALAAVLTAFAIVDPPMTGQTSGLLVTGGIWVLFKVVATIARVVQANVCKSRGKEHLFLYGAVTQAGSFCGALIFYYLCNYTDVFMPAYADC